MSVRASLLVSVLSAQSTASDVSSIGQRGDDVTVMSNMTLQDWSSETATRKRSAVWLKVGADKESYGYMNPLKTLAYAADPSYLRQMQSITSDERELGHEKTTHGIGGHALVHFEWCSNPYTGMFQRADKCMVRIANAAEPSTSWLNPTSYNPNMAVKCFRDGNAKSANLQTIWEIDGYNVIPEGKKDSCSFFEVPLSNHCGRRDNISMTLRDTFIKDFDKVDPRSLMVGVSQMATMNQDGSNVEEPNFPFALVFKPAHGLNDLPCDFNNAMMQLGNIGTEWMGETVFEVFAAHDPSSDMSQMTFMGNMVLDSLFFPSRYGDTQLFFQHTFFETELQRLSEIDSTRAKVWSEFTDPKTAEGQRNLKEQGAAWYSPFLPRDKQTCIKPTNVFV